MTNEMLDQSNKPQVNIRNELSADENRILNELEESLSGLSQGKFLKFNVDERKDLYFLPEKAKVVYAKFNRETNEYNESDKPVEDDENYKMTYKWVVLDPATNRELEWTVSSYKTNSDIISKMRQLKTKFLSIKRIGTGKNTYYDIEAAR